MTAPPPPRQPSFLDALAPVVVLIVLLALTIVLFGIDAADGPLQVALFLSATFAALVAYKNGHPVSAIEEALHVHGERVRRAQQQRDHQRPVLPRRDVEHADHGLADPRRAELRRDHGTRKIHQPPYLHSLMPARVRFRVFAVMVAWL